MKRVMVSSYNGRLTALVGLSCMVAASGGLLFGYDLGISGGVSSMDSFLKAFFPDVYTKRMDAHVGNYCKFDSQLLTAFTSSLYIAGLFASLLASHVTCAFGHRAAILVGGAVFLAGAGIGGGAKNVYMLFLARILLGVGIGFTNQSVPLYLSEMALPQHRGALNNAFEFSVSAGILIANLINYGSQKIQSGWGWRVSLASAVVPAGLLTLGALFLPNTPTDVLQRSGNLQNASLLLQRIRGTGNVQRELDDLVSASAEAKNNSHQFHKILQRRYRPQLVMAISIPFFAQFGPLYLSEMALPQHWGALNNAFEFSVSAGILIANLINYGAQKITIRIGLACFARICYSSSCITYPWRAFPPQHPDRCPPTQRD